MSFWPLKNVNPADYGPLWPLKKVTLNDFKRPLKVVQLLCRKKGRRAFSRQINDSWPCSTGFSNLVKNVII